MENIKISLGQIGEKSRFRELSTDDTTEKKKKKKTPYRQRQKSTNFGLKLFNDTPKFPFKFKEIKNLS